jgi:Flp pilus assembly protein TadD
MYHHARRVRLLLSVALIAVAAGLGGCASKRSAEVTGSTATSAGPRSEGEWRRDVDAWGPRYQANPADAEAAMRYAQALRGIGQRSQAAAVLEQSAIHNPQNKPLLGAYGRALADSGNYKQALEVLNRAHTPDQPDWRILSVQGAVLDQMGQHQEAQRYYASALRLVPDEPSVLSNLGLSYALSKDLPKAEATLRRAIDRPGAAPRVRQNLALVIGLQGRFGEAEKLATADLSSDEAAANVTYLRQMLSQQNDMKRLGRPASATPSPLSDQS